MRTPRVALMESVSARVSATAAATELVSALSEFDCPKAGGGAAAAAACSAMRSAGVVKLTAAHETYSFPIPIQLRFLSAWGKLSSGATGRPTEGVLVHAGQAAQPLSCSQWQSSESGHVSPATISTASTMTPAYCRLRSICGDSTCQSCPCSADGGHSAAGQAP